MNMSVRLQNATEADTCAIVWFGENGSPVLATNRFVNEKDYFTRLILLQTGFLELLICCQQ